MDPDIEKVIKAAGMSTVPLTKIESMLNVDSFLCRFKLRKDPYRLTGTRYLHGTDHFDNTGTHNPTGAVVYPISLATTFRQKSPGVPTNVNDPNSFGVGYEYSRTGNPTRGEFERAMASAESARYCCAFASGSSAVSSVIHLLESGSNVLCIDDVYGGTQRYFRKIVSPSMNIHFSFVDFDNIDEIRKKMKGSYKNTKLIWLESPTNPTLKLSDIRQIANLAHDNGAILAVDSKCSFHLSSSLSHQFRKLKHYRHILFALFSVTT